jgi:hypothetical protein
LHAARSPATNIFWLHITFRHEPFVQPLEPSFLHNAYGHHHYDEGPDLATGALSFLTPVLARQMGDIGSGKSERAQTTILPTPADTPGEPSNLLAIMA